MIKFCGFFVGVGCFVASIGATETPENLYTHQPTVMPSLSLSGKHKVGVTTLKVINKDQIDTSNFLTKEDRPLTLEVWYPATLNEKSINATYDNVTRSKKQVSLAGEAYRDANVSNDGPYPLIVLSHGYTGHRHIMFYLGEHLASHGYVVAAIDHTHSTNAEVDFEKDAGSGFVSTLLNRARDQQFVLDYFSESSSSLAKQIDTFKAAVIGHSMGGFGAINTVGGCYDFTVEGLKAIGFPSAAAYLMFPMFNFCHAARDEVDTRWKSMVAMAPWGQQFDVHTPESLGKLAVPSLYIAGDQDDISGYANGVKELFEQTSAKDNYMLVYRDARHNIAAHPAPKAAFDNDFDLGHFYEPSWNIESINRINEHMILAFVDCYVKGEKERCDMLPTRPDITQHKQEDGSFTPPWPGFSERWGTGVSFYRNSKVK